MDSPPIRKQRPPAAKPAAPAPRRKSGPYTAAGQARGLAARLLLTAGATAVFIAAYLFDPAAVVRLFRACLAGQAGLPARLAAFGSLLLLVCMIGAVLYRPAEPRPATPRKRAARPVTRRVEQEDRPDAAGTEPRGKTAAVKRRGRKGTGVA